MKINKRREKKNNGAGQYFSGDSCILQILREPVELI